jgi:hypothetical protein
MALIDDLQINLPNRRLNVNASAGTFYTARSLYSLIMDLFDELGGTALAGALAYPTPFSAQTPTDITLKDGWYMTEVSYLRLNGGSIQSSGFDTEIYRLTINSSGYTNAVVGDLYRTVTGGTSAATARLLYYDNTARVWIVRKVSGTLVNNETLAITGGTGAGTTATSGGVTTGEDKWANAFVLGTVNHFQGTYWEQNGVAVDPVTAGYYATAPSSAPDLLIKIQQVGSVIASGIVTFFNRVNRDLANSIDSSLTGDTYDWFQVDLSGLGRNPVPLNTRADLDDTLTNSAAAAYTGILFETSGPYNVDVDQDGSTEAYTGRVQQDTQTNAILWGVIKWFFRKGNTTTVNSVQAQLFRTLNGSYTATKDSPIGSIAGGTIYYARGWVPINMAAGDASRYQVTSNAGVLKNPPTFRLRAVTGLPTGAKVFLALRSANNIANTAEFTLASGNNSGNGTLVLSSSIPSDKPSSGFVRVFDNSGNEDRYAYTSYSGATLTLSGTLSKTYATSNAAYIPYIDTTSGGASVSTSLRYVADRNVVLNVRLGSGVSKIVPFPSNYTLGDADSSVPATAIADTINSN